MNLRLDRLATVYLVSPLLRMGSRNQFSIPILMYHSIADEDESNVPAYYRTATSPAAFYAQMAYLRENGYQTCSPAQSVDLIKSSVRTGLKSVVITFDDGYQNFYRNAFPILNDFGFTATVYLPTAFIGDETLKFKGRDCLKWSEVRELQKYGISFGSHTVTHPQLCGLNKESIQGEVVNSKKAIEEKTGSAVDSFAYPYAFPQVDAEFKRMLRESLHSAGYRSGVCTVIGRASRTSDQLFMERLPVNGFDDVALFRAKLNGAYDWISKPQSWLKVSKAGMKKLCGPS